MAAEAQTRHVERAGTYKGQTLNQVRHGQGKYIYNNAFFAYEGTWVEGWLIYGTTRNCL